jgi:integrase
MERARISTNHLLRFFAGADAREPYTDKVREYIRFRQRERTHRGFPPVPGTINRELAALMRIFRLATLSTPPKIQSVPYIPMLKEENVRTGFFEWDGVQRLLPSLPSHMKPLVLCAFFTGMRKGELLALRWKNVDVEEGVIRLEAAMTKTREGRVIYVPKNLRASGSTARETPAIPSANGYSAGMGSP